MSTAFREARELSAAAARDFERRALTYLSTKAVSPSIDVGSVIGGGMGSQYAGQAIFSGMRTEQAYQYLRNWVYCCVHAIAWRVAGQPITAAAVTNAPANPERRGTAMHKSVTRKWPLAVRMKQNQGQQVEPLVSHPALDLMARPNSIQKKWEFLYCSAANLVLTGEAYWIGGIGKDKDVELWALPTSWIIPLHNSGLFGGDYKLAIPGMASEVILPEENVARTYLPDPSNIKRAMPPLKAVMSAIKTDDRIQDSQLQMFERGIHPNLIVTVGKNIGPDGKRVDTRPALTGAQRRQLIRAIRQVWNDTVNYGDPAIVDGLIESIHKLQATPQEMDWERSGEIVKKRIMQAFGVNPIVLGEIQAGNRAQAVMAEQNFLSQAVNPVINAFSESLTDFLGPMFAKPQRLEVWIEECEAKDDDLELARWTTAREKGDVTRDEFRSEMLSLAPMATGEAEEVYRNPLLETIGGMQGSVQVLTAVSQGMMAPEAGSKILQLFLQINSTLADSIAGVGKRSNEPVRPAESEEEMEEEPELEEEGEELSEEERSVAPEVYKSTTKDWRHKFRERVKSVHLKQFGDLEQDLTAALDRHFADVIRGAAKKLGNVSLSPAASKEQVMAAVERAFDKSHWDEQLYEAITNPLVRAFVAGVELEKAASKAAVAIEKRLPDLPEELPPIAVGDVLFGFSFDAYPQWMLDAAKAILEITFKQPYWQKLHITTMEDIFRRLWRGLEEAWTMREIAEDIAENLLHEGYTKARGMNIARTETGNMLNSGHDAAIRHVEEETGIPQGKEWLSVLGSTTRPEHAALDGTVVGIDEEFDLDGTMIPWPSHWALPAAQRCSCQCGLLSVPMPAKSAKHLPGQHDQGTHGEGGGGAAESAGAGKRTEEQTMTPKTKSEIAKAAAKRVDGEIQSYSKQHNESVLAKALGGKSFPDSEPVDVELEIGGKKHGIELKTMVDNKRNALTMKPEAMERKRQWARKEKAQVHTVVFDDQKVFNAKGPGQHDESQRRIFYRRGYGSFSVNAMHEVKGGIGELKSLLDTPTRRLPKGAKQWDIM